MREFLLFDYEQIGACLPVCTRSSWFQVNSLYSVSQTTIMLSKFTKICEGIVQKKIVLEKNYLHFYAALFSVVLLAVTILDGLYNATLDGTVIVTLDDSIILAIACLCELIFIFSSYYSANHSISIFLQFLGFTAHIFSIFSIQAAIKRTNFVSTYVSLRIVYGMLSGASMLSIFAVCVTYSAMIYPWSTKIMHINNLIVVWGMFGLGQILRSMKQRIIRR